MNFILDFEGFEKYLVDKTIDSLMGVHYVFKFENGYGASVVKGAYRSYGGPQNLWELAVLNFYEVLELLGRIKALEKPVHIKN